MPSSLVFSLAALAALGAASFLSLRQEARRDSAFWILIAVAVAVPVAWAVIQVADTWDTGLSAALWVSIAATMCLFAVLAAAGNAAWRLTPLLLPYLLLLGIVATVWQQAPERPLLGTAPTAWLEFHILVSVVAYSLLTIAAVAGLAVFLQEWALKAKRPTALTRLLPSVADSETLQVRLLIAAEAALALGLLSGAAVEYYEAHGVPGLGHKTLFSVLTFVVIAALLVAHYRTGVRGRRAARLVLLAYLLLTLAYPGVKFVTDVLLA